MNNDKVEGKFDQVAGKIKQTVGEAVGNDRLANAGAADQVKGAAKETWGNAKDAVGTVHDDAAARARVENDNLKYTSENKAHNVREKIVATAQHIKENVNEKLDNMRHDHQR
jgi:uncharacterized protein YjbJ (UPF0337 family)